MNAQRLCHLICLTLASLLHSEVCAEIQLASVFGDHMVLQQNSDVRLWGSASPAEKVQVSASWGPEKAAMADEQGNWAMSLKTPAGGHEAQSIAFRGDNEIVVNDVLIGEVWLCSGQSNMAWRVRQAADATQEIANATHPSLRFFSVPTKMAWQPQTSVDAKWVVCSPDSIAGQSAVAYFFARELQEKLDVPIGLLVSAFGGSDAQAWLHRDVARAEGLGEIVDWYDRHASQMQSDHEKYQNDMAAWRASQPKDGKPDASTRPKRLLPGDQHIPFGLYNSMIHPIESYTIRGALWYQGESNVPRAHQYLNLFPAVISSFRKVWRQGDFPFYFVQVAPFNYRDPEGVASAELRNAQLETLNRVNNTGMVVISDIGNVSNIHPKNKQDVGRRLALLAMHNDYGGGSRSYSSAFYCGHKSSCGKIRINFKHACQLKVRGEKIVGFQIAGEDRQFVDAQAQIVCNNQVDVWSDQVRCPVAVRYGWQNAAEMNLFNEIDLPVSTFKTDDWPYTTAGQKFREYPVQ